MTATPAPAPDGHALEARLAEVLRGHLWTCDDDDCLRISIHQCRHLAAALAPVVSALLDERVERAVGEALEAAAVRIEGMGKPNPVVDTMAFEMTRIKAARLVREGGTR